jgi:hypothetical protein
MSIGLAKSGFLLVLESCSHMATKLFSLPRVKPVLESRFDFSGVARFSAVRACGGSATTDPRPLLRAGTGTVEEGGDDGDNGVANEVGSCAGFVFSESVFIVGVIAAEVLAVPHNFGLLGSESDDEEEEEGDLRVS